MKSIFKIVGGVFKWIWRLINFVRLAIYNLFFFIIIGLLYLGYSQTNQITATPEIKDSSALLLNISGPIVEQRRYINPMDSLTGSVLGKEMPRENVLFDIVDTIRHAAEDEHISGLVLGLSDMSETNLTKLRYIAKAINDFKATGKPVYATSDLYSQSQYYLASYADKVYMSPDGAILLRGYGSYPLYYKRLLDYLDVTTHVFRVGTYKSAVEPFLRDDMSDEAKASATAWLSQLWGAFVSDVSSNRNIDPSVVNPSMDAFLANLKSVHGDLAQYALQNGLVDQLSTRQEVRNDLAQVFGREGKDSFKATSYYDYRASMSPYYNASSFNSSDDDIAVIVASGTIMDGQQPRGTIGGDSTAALLRQARNDDNVKAVVLRVDSPGGSAFASEVIRNEVDAIRAAGKPVVVSMSSLAASGGYWISMSADKIVAQPTTLTGSIGIFSVITTFEKGLDNLGISSDGVGTTPFAGIGFARGIPDKAGEAFQLGIENGYHRFISLVSEHRNLSLEDVDSIAQGRVWTGSDAMKAGLVDAMGDFDDAIELAAKLADMETYNIYWVQEPLSTTEQFLQQLTDSLNASLSIDLSALLPNAIKPVSQQIVADTELLGSFNDPKGYYSLCLTCQVE